MMNPIDIIQESVKEYKLSIAQARRNEIRKLLDYYTGTETDTWRIRKFSGGSETTLDTDVVRNTLTNPTGTNYTKTIELASPMNVAEGDLIFIKRQTNGGSVTHVSAMLYVSFAG